MLERRAAQTLVQALDRQAAVALIGPRQVGKTTLAHAVAQHRNALYLDLESTEDRGKLAYPETFLRSYEDRLVILDEVHRVPELFQSLRGLIDEGRRRGRRTGRFLVLGSAAIELLQQSGESLAGRIAYVELGPLDVQEIGAQAIGMGADRLNRLWVRGGFPDSYLAGNDATSLSWRKDFIRTYLERDVPMFGPRVPSETLQRLWTMLATSQGTPLNSSRLAMGLEISAPSVTRYLDLLCDLLLVRRLPAFSGNLGKRLVKAPKVYIRDSGLLHALLNIQDHNELAGHQVVGASWEGFVIENLLGVMPWRTHASYYRSSGGAEVDLILEFPDRACWAIEIKRSPAAKPRRGFHQACEDLKPERAFVVYADTTRFPLNAEGTIEGIGLGELMQELAKRP
jgi:predicted AAA+ superfamily ATPase